MINKIFTKMKTILILLIITLFAVSIITSGCRVDISEASTTEITVVENADTETGQEESAEPVTVEEETISGIQDISVDRVYEILKNEEAYFILDVRTREEYNEEHIEGANLIPMQELANRLDELPVDKPVIVYCKSGIRSRESAQFLVDSGFSQVYDMGGMEEWKEKGYPVVHVVTEDTWVDEHSDIINISVDDAYEYYEDEDHVFLDVRSEEEFESGYIKGALLIPLSEIEERLDEIPADKGIIVYCNGSSCDRSGFAAMILIEAGYTEVYDMGGGGIIEWMEKGYPVEK